MNEMKRWGKVGGDAAPAPKEEDEASASPPAPATQAMTGSSSLSTQIAAQKKMLAQLKQEAKAKKLPAKAKKLKASKQEKLKVSAHALAYCTNSSPVCLSSAQPVFDVAHFGLFVRCRRRRLPS